MLMDRCSRKRCNNSSQAGLIIGQLQGLETPGAVSGTPHLGVWLGDWGGRVYGLVAWDFDDDNELYDMIFLSLYGSSSISRGGQVQGDLQESYIAIQFTLAREIWHFEAILEVNTIGRQSPIETSSPISTSVSDSPPSIANSQLDFCL